MTPLAIHTDACKGLENAVKAVFPHAEQRECFGHIWMNVIKKHRGEDFGRLWPAARSYSKQTHAYHLAKVIAADPEFQHWLEAYHSLLWYRSAFNTAIKCDHINNNLAESFNNKVKELKDLPVHDMADWRGKTPAGRCRRGLHLLHRHLHHLHHEEIGRASCRERVSSPV